MRTLRFIALTALLVLGLSSTVSAQTANATPSGMTHFSVSSQALSLAMPGSGAQTAASTTGNFQMSKSWSVGFQNITVPSAIGYNFGLVQFNRNLAALLGSKIANSLSFNATNVIIGFEGGAGLAAPNTGSKRVAETAGVNVSFPMVQGANGVSLGPIVSFQWVHSGIAGSQILTNPSSASLAAGLGLTF